MSLQRSPGRTMLLRAVAPLVLLFFAGPALAEDFYYLAMFGSQTTPADPNYSHTFATFVHATGEGPCPQAFIVEDCFTISWLPADLKVRTRALLPECGHNFGLHETLHYALSSDERVSLWGPYQIEPRLYFEAARQHDVLESGEVRYKAVDSGFPTDRVSNCIHAVASVVDGYRVRVASPWFGETASWTILKRFEPSIINTSQTHDWVFTYLGLEQYPLTRRDYENPRVGPLRTAVRTVLGTEP